MKSSSHAHHLPWDQELPRDQKIVLVTVPTASGKTPDIFGGEGKVSFPSFSSPASWHMLKDPHHS